MPGPVQLDDVSQALRQRFGKTTSVEHSPPILKVRQGLNRGVNIRLLLDVEPTKIEASPRSYMDDNSNKIVKAASVICAFIGLGTAIAMWHWSGLEVQSGRMARGIVDMCFLYMAFFGIGGTIASIIGTTVISGRSAELANREWARNLEAWLNQSVGKK
jgi:hypothetical protein